MTAIGLLNAPQRGCDMTDAMKSALTPQGYLAAAELAFNAGDMTECAANQWQAVRVAAVALAKRQGWPHDTDDEIVRFINHWGEQSPDGSGWPGNWLTLQFGVAGILDNYARGYVKLSRRSLKKYRNAAIDLTGYMLQQAASETGPR